MGSVYLPFVPESDWWQRSPSACIRPPHSHASLSCRAWRRLAASWCAVFWAPALFSVRAGVSCKEKKNMNNTDGRRGGKKNWGKRKIVVPQWRQKQRGSGCAHPLVKQRERGYNAMGPCLFNHVQLLSHSPSCREITLPVMATKPSRPHHIVNWLEPTHSQRHPAPAPDLLSNNLFDTSAVLVLWWPWIMEISVITTSGRSQHFPLHTLGMWIQIIWALI